MQRQVQVSVGPMVTLYAPDVKHQIETLNRIEHTFRFVLHQFIGGSHAMRTLFDRN